MNKQKICIKDATTGETALSNSSDSNNLEREIIGDKSCFSYYEILDFSDLIE